MSLNLVREKQPRRNKREENESIIAFIWRSATSFCEWKLLLEACPYYVVYGLIRIISILTINGKILIVPHISC